VKFSFLAWLPVAVMAVYGWLVVAEQEATRDSYRWYWYGFATISSFIIFVPILGPIAITLIGVVGIFIPRLAYWSIDRARAQISKDATKDSRTQSLAYDKQIHEDIRKKQAAESLKDTSPMLPIGRSLGVLRKDGDPLTPDPGTMLMMSVNDASTHTMVSGLTGTGKSVLLKKMLQAWVGHSCGGFLALDPGKGELPYDLASILDHLVTPDTFYLNLLEGLDPPVASKIIFDVTSNNAQDGAVWDKGMEEMIRYALFVLRDARRVAWLRPVVDYSLLHMYIFAKDAKFRAEILPCLPAPESEASRLARDYWSVQYPEMGNDTRSSLDFTLSASMSSIIGTEKLSRWTTGRSDADIIEAVAHGAHVGVAASPAVYGVGGILATALVKGALYNRISKRVTNKAWRKEEAPVMLIVDECATAITDNDSDFARIGRGIGCYLTFATQDFDGFEKKLSTEASATAFLGQFRSCISLTTTEKTLKYISGFAGKRQRWIPDKSKAEGAPLLKILRSSQGGGLESEHRGRVLDSVASVTGAIAKIRQSLSSSLHAHKDGQSPLRKSATIAGTVENGPTISVEELQTYLSRKYTAFCVINRAGSPRREIVDLTDPDLLPANKEPAKEAA
jgi:hypothetical protein